VSLAQNKLLEARKQYQAALDIRTKSGAKQLAAQSSIYLGELSIEEGNAEAAEIPLRQAIVISQREHAISDEIKAQEELATAFLAVGRQADATAQISVAKLLMKGREDIANRLRMGIVEGRIQAAAGNYKDARENFNSTVLLARAQGFVKFQYEALLALDEAEIKFANRADGLAHLAQLQKDAAASGLLLLASKAEAAGR
jgi:tetratricopeptide (TPR) repeat protein